MGHGLFRACQIDGFAGNALLPKESGPQSPCELLRATPETAILSFHFSQTDVRYLPHIRFL